MLTLKRLREVLNYDPETGIFTRNMKSGVKKVAGSKCNEYLRICIDKKEFYQHRLAWFYFYGEWPVNFIDHINNIKTDNRIKNLRDITDQQNKQNRGKAKRNTTGYKGVVYSKRDNVFYGRIRHNGKMVHLGSFKKPKDAYSAYCQAAAKYHTHNPSAILTN